MLVSKPDGSLRFCLDYSKLNSKLFKDSYPLLRTDECIDSLANATVFSTLDCKSSYWKLNIEEKVQAKTAFPYHAGALSSCGCPLGSAMHSPRSNVQQM